MSGKTYTIIGAQFKTYQCPSCRKNIHCIAGYENEGDPVELLKDRCGKDCECKCRTYYLAKNGKLRKYGTIDDTSVMEQFSEEHSRDELDDFIDKINMGFKST
jgi:hypothetical protein